MPRVPTAEALLRDGVSVPGLVTDFDPRLVEVLEEAQRLGMIGKAPLESHLEQACEFFRVAEDLLSPDAKVLDLGSGGGLPGLVIAARWPSLRVTLLDGRSSRAEHLDWAVRRLGWEDRVRVVGQRAEAAAQNQDLRAAFDLVVARGFGPPAVVAECAAPFLRLGGLLVVSDPPSGGERERWPSAGCAEFGLEALQSQVEPWSFTVLRQVVLCDSKYPRRNGLPSKRPLF